MKIRKCVYVVMFGLAFCAFGLSGIKLVSISRTYEKSEQEYKQLRADVVLMGPQQAAEGWLKEVNPDYIAWLQIVGTPIDYPIVMESGKDYLTTGFSGEDNIAGTPFVRRAQNAFMDHNTVIFGHNMKNGTMFAALKKYLDTEFGLQHPEVTIRYKGITRKYRVFSVQLLNEDDGSVFAYSFRNENEYKQFVSQMHQKSLVQLADAPPADKKMITLSTCHGKDKKLIVQACEEAGSGEQQF